MFVRYVLADLVRNPRRTLSTMVGVTLGVGLFCGVLFFVDGLSASMTQRAVAPLAIDMQRIVTERVGGSVTLGQTFDHQGIVAAGDRIRVELALSNSDDVAANEVTVRSVPIADLQFVPGSASLDGEPIVGIDDNPFAHDPGQTGFNLGTVEPGESHQLGYAVEARAAAEVSDATVATTVSTRESVNPFPANQSSSVSLTALAAEISAIDGVAQASPLSLADLGTDTLSADGTTAPGPVKIFGFDEGYESRDQTIVIAEGRLVSDKAVISAEAAEALHIGIGDTVTIALPDGSTLDLEVSGIADLSRSRSLFASRRGGDLETFIYTRNSVVVSPDVFAESVHPAYERAAAARGTRLKTPPVREVDITLERHLLDADPASAAVQTKRIGEAVTAIAANQDYLLDNISNTLAVATADARVAKRLFVFLGVPGGLLAAMLAAYAGTVLADAQRREQATLRIRGASRRHLLRMLAVRTGLLTASGAVIGLVLGYGLTVMVLGRESISRASVSALVTSALLGTVGGFLATGLALYVSGRRSIDREINEDRARLAVRPPLWRRTGLDMIGVAVVAVGTTIALRARAFDGSAGSVYFGRAVTLNLALLVLPVAVWIAGSLLAARLVGAALHRTQPRSSPSIGRPVPSLYRLSVGRRPWAISNGGIIVTLIVALATSLAAFTASYDAAKVDDARYANGSDIRITPGPTSQRPYTVDDVGVFRTEGIAATTPVIFGLSNVILRSDRTSDPANLAAIDPQTYLSVSPLVDVRVPTSDVATALATLTNDPTAVMLSEDMAAFLKAKPGDAISVLLARSTDDQLEVELRVSDLFERLPGFPEGADALMSIGIHTANVPTKAPDFFLASTVDGSDVGLRRAVDSLLRGPAASDHLRIDTRATTLATDQSSLAALNIAGLVDLDSTFSLSMAMVTIAIFVFGLLLQRRREYITLRAQGLEASSIRRLIAAEAATVAIVGVVAGVLVGAAMGYYFVTVLRPLFVLTPNYAIPVAGVAIPAALVFVATVVSTVAASRLVNRLEPTELLRDE